MADPPPGRRALALLRTGYADWVSAVHWLTRLPWPVPRSASAAPRSLAAALWAFPVVGALIGALGGLLYWFARYIGASPDLAAVAAIGAMILLTGALHEDGFADFCDGLGRRGDPAERIAAMRDSRLGAFGVIGLILILLARVGALGMAGGGQGIWLLVAAGALGRAAIGPVMRALPPATADGAGAAAGRPSFGGVTIGASLALGLFGLAAGALGLGAGAVLWMLGLACLIASALAWSARRAFGGYTGDVLGAVSLAVETIVLTLLAIAAA